MASNETNRPSGQKRQWFARRQVYLRTGQESRYVELSPMLQIGVALGFAALALLLVGASYSAFTGVLGKSERTALLAKLDTSEQAFGELEQERDAALEDASKLIDLEAALADAEARAKTTSNEDETQALTTELEQTRLQLEELQQRLSESKADQAALQARFEAESLATTDTGEKTAEEAASLHAQLEEAFNEIAALQEKNNVATAEVAALNENQTAKDEAIERNTALLKAATAEIERLQETVKQVNIESQRQIDDHEKTIVELEKRLGETVAERDGIELELDRLAASANEAEAVALLAADSGAVDGVRTDVAADARMHALSIAADLKEADLLTTIDDLRTELTAAATESGDRDAGDGERLAALRNRATVAEAEIERLILAGLKDDGELAETPAPTVVEEDPAETERLRSELLAAEADIIKLNADVKAAKFRLAEQAETQNGQASKPDNSAKLEQQLASSRSRVQQLNKALADAKLREVAIDLALINVVPTPSPPAPR